MPIQIGWVYTRRVTARAKSPRLPGVRCRVAGPDNPSSGGGARENRQWCCDIPVDSRHYSSVNSSRKADNRTAVVYTRRARWWSAETCLMCPYQPRSNTPAAGGHTRTAGRGVVPQTAQRREGGGRWVARRGTHSPDPRETWGRLSSPGACPGPLRRGPRERPIGHSPGCTYRFEPLWPQHTHRYPHRVTPTGADVYRSGHVGAGEPPDRRGCRPRRLREQRREEFALRRSEVLAESRLRDTELRGDGVRVGAAWPVEVARVKGHL